ncbi:MAG: helix-turn-helix domain-containing protein [Spirochaetales bacterium]|nr:helix-turn-helix domain-containing protein [Spirochaetales bacterium]
MEKIMYTVGEIAEILGLHPKTVQRFIREGSLKARKIGRAWKIHVDDFKEYAHGELAPKSSAEISSAPAIPIEHRLSVSAVIELRNAQNDEASRISNTLIAVLNGKDPAWGASRYDFLHDRDTGTARFILYGTPLFISSIMKMLDPLLAG